MCERLARERRKHEPGRAPPHVLLHSANSQKEGGRAHSHHARPRGATKRQEGAGGKAGLRARALVCVVLARNPSSPSLPSSTFVLRFVRHDHDGGGQQQPEPRLEKAPDKQRVCPGQTTRSSFPASGDVNPPIRLHQKGPNKQRQTWRLWREELVERELEKEARPPCVVLLKAPRRRRGP